jgi:hypothetical protein
MCAQSSLNFDDYFVDKTMRLDYFHIGDAKEEWVAVDQIFEQGIWAGSKRNLIDKLDNGRYYAKIYDSSSGKPGSEGYKENLSRDNSHSLSQEEYQINPGSEE